MVESCCEYLFSSILLKTFTFVALFSGLWKEYKLKLAFAASFSSTVLIIYLNAAVSTGMLASCLILSADFAVVVSVKHFSSSSGPVRSMILRFSASPAASWVCSTSGSSDESKISWTTASISPCARARREANFTSFANGKTFFKFSNFWVKCCWVRTTGEGDGCAWAVGEKVVTVAVLDAPRCLSLLGCLWCNWIAVFNTVTGLTSFTVAAISCEYELMLLNRCRCFSSCSCCLAEIVIKLQYFSILY